MDLPQPHDTDRRAAAFAGLLLAAMAASPAAAQTLQFHRPEPSKSVNLEIQGGFQAVTTFWPATFVFDGFHGGVCTATAVGPRILLTAAHCVAEGGAGVIVKTSNSLTCWRHDRWSGPKWDVALCLSKKDIKLDNGAPYETLSKAAGEPAMHRDLTLLGYGCTVAGGSKGVLYEGVSPVSGTATTAAPFFTTFGTVAVCSGDSGGGAYLPGAGTSRSIVGVASMVTGTKASDFAAVPDADVRRWITVDWRNDRLKEGRTAAELRICGIDDALNVCHG